MSDKTTQNPQDESPTEIPAVVDAEATEPTVEAPVEAEISEPVVEEAAPAEASSEVQEVTEPEPVYKSKLVGFDELKPGQTIRLHERIIDVSAKGEERRRIQVFEGIILGLRGGGVSRTLTVRKISGGVGVEKIYPVNSPVIEKIELVKTARVRRAKLSFLTSFKRRFKRKLQETYEIQTKSKKRA